jgi:hypothetical protein
MHLIMTCIFIMQSILACMHMFMCYDVVHAIGSIDNYYAYVSILSYRLPACMFERCIHVLGCDIIHHAIDPACMHACMHACMYVCTYVCMMHVLMYVCIDICMY